MARNRFGGSAAEWFVAVRRDGTYQRPTGLPTVTFWSGTPADLGRVMYDDLRALDDLDTPVNSVTGLADGTMPEFDGPDDDTITRMWASTDGGVTGTWITTTSLPSRSQGERADTALQPDENGKLPEANVPDRLSEGELSATFVGATAIANAAIYGDGATDAKAHLQAKADALAATGGEIRLPRGVYLMSGPIFLPSGVALRGEGRHSIIKANYGGTGLVYNKGWNDGIGNEDITVADLTVDGSGTASNGIIVAGVRRGTIHNVRVKSCVGYGIWLWRSGENASQGVEGVPTEQVTVSSCHVTDGQDVGIEFSGCLSCVVVGNTVEVTTSSGISLWNGAQDCVVEGNAVVGVGVNNTAVGFDVQPNDVGQATPTRRVTFIGNTARNVERGLRLKGYTGRPVYDVTATGNTFYATANGGARGVDLGNANGVRISNNTISGYNNPLGVDTPTSGQVPGEAKAVSFDGNIVRGFQSVLIYGLTSGSISGNVFTESTNTAVQLYGVSNLVCSDNTFRNLGAEGGNTPGVLVQKYNTTQSMGCVFMGNKASDDRASKGTGRCVILSDASDRHVMVGNSAYGAKAGSQAVLNAGTGTNNVIANNIDQP